MSQPDKQSSARSTGRGRKVTKRNVSQVFGESVSRIQRDECGDQAEGRAARQHWERWLTDQKPPHYDY